MTKVGYLSQIRERKPNLNPGYKKMGEEARDEYPDPAFWGKGIFLGKKEKA